MEIAKRSADPHERVNRTCQQRRVDNQLHKDKQARCEGHDRRADNRDAEGGVAKGSQVMLRERADGRARFRRVGRGVSVGGVGGEADWRRRPRRGAQSGNPSPLGPSRNPSGERVEDHPRIEAERREEGYQDKATAGGCLRFPALPCTLFFCPPCLRATGHPPCLLWGIGP